MAVLSQAKSESLVRDAVVLDLGDLRAQAERMLEEARAQADAVVEEAHRERERILEGAEASGHAAGLEAGRVTGREEGQIEGRSAALEEWNERLTHVCAALESALAEFRQARELIAEEGRDDVLAFAVAVAEQVSRRVVDLDKNAAVVQCEAALAIVLRPSSLVISAHPEDLPLLEEAAPSLLRRFADTPDVRFLADESVSRGSATVRTDRGVVEADVDEQIAQIVNKVRPVLTDRADSSESS